MMERERIMAEKEKALREKQRQEEIRIAKEKAEKLAKIQEQYEKSKADDANLVGYYSNYNIYMNGVKVVRNSNPSIKKEEVKPKESIEGIKRTSGWVKREDGSWGPARKDTGSLYINPPSTTYLPSDVWLDLDLLFGFRRENSPDFNDSLGIIIELFKHYYEQDGMAQKLISVLNFAFEKPFHSQMPGPFQEFKKSLSPILGIIEESHQKELASLYPNLSICKRNEANIAHILEMQQKIDTALSTTSKLLTQSYACHENDISRLHPEILISHVFPNCDMHSLAQCSLVCRKWNSLANEQSIYQCILLNQLEVKPQNLPVITQSKSKAVQLYLKGKG